MARYLVQKQVTGLPPGYKRYEYLTSPEGPVIDTGIQLASTDVVMMKFRNASATKYGGIYGVFKMGQSSAFYANGTYYGYDENNYKVDTGVAVDTNWHEVVHDFVNGKLTIDDVTTTFTPFTFANTVNSPLFARYYNNSVGYYFKGDIAYFKVYRNDVLILDLVPCKKGNLFGMYDLVGESFHQKGVSGIMTVGPEAFVTQKYCVGKLGARYVINKEVS